MPALPASGINAAFGIFVFGAFAVPFRPAAGWVAAVGSTRAVADQRLGGPILADARDRLMNETRLDLVPLACSGRRAVDLDR